MSSSPLVTTDALSPEVRKLCLKYAAAVDAIRQWTEIKDDLSALLIQGYASGDLPKTVKLPDGRKLGYNAGREITAYDEDVKLAIKNLQEQAKRDGLCHVSTGNPFLKVS